GPWRLPSRLARAASPPAPAAEVAGMATAAGAQEDTAMAEDRRDLWKTTSIGLVIAAIVAVVTGIVVANRTSTTETKVTAPSASLSTTVAQAPTTPAAQPATPAPATSAPARTGPWRCSSQRE